MNGKQNSESKYPSHRDSSNINLMETHTSLPDLYNIQNKRNAVKNKKHHNDIIKERNFTSKPMRSPLSMDLDPAERRKPPLYMDLDPAERRKPPLYMDLDPAERRKPPSFMDLDPAERRKPPLYMDLDPAERRKPPLYMDLESLCMDLEPPKYRKSPLCMDLEPPKHRKPPLCHVCMDLEPPKHFISPSFMDLEFKKHMDSAIAMADAVKHEVFICPSFDDDKEDRSRKLDKIREQESPRIPTRPAPPPPDVLE